MSVVTGSPVCDLTSASISKPASKPQPRAVTMLERFALSNEPLNITLIGKRSLSCANFSAMTLLYSACNAQGPAIRRRFSPAPQRYGPIFAGLFISGVIQSAGELLARSLSILADFEGNYIGFTPTCVMCQRITRFSSGTPALRESRYNMPQ